MSYLYDGNDQNIKIPPISIYYENNYKNFNIPNISAATIEAMCTYNPYSSKSTSSSNIKTSSLFGFLSLINHNKKTNVYCQQDKDLVVVYALEDIDADQELVVDYIQDTVD